MNAVTSAEKASLTLAALRQVLPAHAVLSSSENTTPYECDGLTAYRQRPMCVVLPETYDQVQAVLRTCHRLGVPVVARGAGTGLSGGAMPHPHGVTLSLAKFNQIMKMDAHSRTAVVQGGVRNLAISESAAPLGLYYAPDPGAAAPRRVAGNRIPPPPSASAAARAPSPHSGPPCRSRPWTPARPPW